MVCAVGGTIGATPGGPSGVGVTMLAPGDPVPGTSGTEAVDCGPTRLCVCARAGEKAQTLSAASIVLATAIRAPLRKAFVPPRITAFLDLNHGNFKPPAGAPGRIDNAGLRGMWLTLCLFSPYPHVTVELCLSGAGRAPPGKE
jgi:hypothetical protein